MIALSHDSIFLLINLSIKALVLTALAAAGLAMFRVRDANVRHRVWTAVAIGMLAMPIVQLAMPSFRLPAWLSPQFGALADDPPQNQVAIASPATTPPTPAAKSSPPLR